MATLTTKAAIHAVWNADPGLSAEVLKLYNEEPSESTELSTYFVIEDYSEDETFLNSKGKKLIEVTWAFVGYVVGTANAEDLALLVRAAFNAASLTLESGRRCLLMTETGYAVELERTRSTATQRVTRVRLDYRAQLTGV